MDKKRKIAPIIRKVSFAQAEEEEIAYYAQNSWQNSVRIVEEMRQQIWHKVYAAKRELVIFKRTLKDESDDFE